MNELESEINQRFSEVQKQTAMKILSRYLKPKKTNEIEIQTEEDHALHYKYEQKKEKVRKLYEQKQQLEKEVIDMGRHLNSYQEEVKKARAQAKTNEETVNQQEEKINELIKKEIHVKLKNDELNKQLQDLD